MQMWYWSWNKNKLGPGRDKAEKEAAKRRREIAREERKL